VERRVDREGVDRVGQPIPLIDLGRQHRPLMPELRAAFERVVGASAFILGDEVQAFEAEFAASCGVAQCVGVGSGTAALMIMMKAAGIGRGDEVIVPAHTFVASAFSVIHAGATPVCVDVLPGSGLIDPAAVRAAIGPRTVAIMAVHLYGQTCAMDELRQLADAFGLTLLEDAAQAHGATWKGRPAGGLGTVAAFSFYPSKNLGALGDGGAICTDDPEVALAARRLRDLGRERGGPHLDIGFNERLDGLQAALLRVKLPHLAAWIRSRRRLAGVYRERLAGAAELLAETTESPCTFHLFPVRVAGRAAVAKQLAERGIATGIHYPLVLPDQPGLRGLAACEAPIARDWADRELSLPMFPEMTDAEVERVADGLAGRVSARSPAIDDEGLTGKGG
jgi:dTDP-4-amino-4,6-dideoxygalactose transaminase